MGVTLVVALGAALLFLVIGMVLQFWQHHKPFASWWPVVLAFPVTWGLLLPEVLGPRGFRSVLDDGGIRDRPGLLRPLDGAGDRA